MHDMSYRDGEAEQANREVRTHVTAWGASQERDNESPIESMGYVRRLEEGVQRSRCLKQPAGLVCHGWVRGMYVKGERRKY